MTDMPALPSRTNALIGKSITTFDAAKEVDEPIDVEYRVIGESFPLGVLVAETYEPEGPWSPDPCIDRRLAPIRRANLKAERRNQIRRLIEEQRRLYPPWWFRTRTAVVDWLRRATQW
jgi:hypothetical protein